MSHWLCRIWAFFPLSRAHATGSIRSCSRAVEECAYISQIYCGERGALFWGLVTFLRNPQHYISPTLTYSKNWITPFHWIFFCFTTGCSQCWDFFVLVDSLVAAVYWFFVYKRKKRQSIKRVNYLPFHVTSLSPLSLSPTVDCFFLLFFLNYLTSIDRSCQSFLLVVLFLCYHHNLYSSLLYNVLFFVFKLCS